MKSEFFKEIDIFFKKNKQFFFIVDYNCKNYWISSFENAFNNNILFNIDGIKNYNEKKILIEKFNFNYSIIPYKNYYKSFKKVQNEINNGNTYLLNLTFETELNTNLTFDQIFHLSNSKYKVLYKNDFVVFSPETFVKIKENKIFSYPMKGTEKTNNEFPSIQNNLKEIYEHDTIVDFVRNDLGRVSKKIKVNNYRNIEKIVTNFGHIFQMTSEIEGTLEEKYINNYGEILKELLPAASVTGAPKLKTLDIISKVENYQRDFYTGICGVINGNTMISSVLIRFIQNKSNKFFYKSGGGITFKSDPKKEYEELKNKIYVPFN